MKATRTPLSTSVNGHLEGLALVASIGGQDHNVTTLILDGPPASKARPRFSRNGNTYVPKKDRQAEAATAKFLRQHFATPMPGNVAVACIFYRPNFQRIDVDNMLKHVCDAANGILWADDSQVTALVGIAHLDVDDPRTVIAIAPHVSTLVRGADAVYPCAVCEKPISRIGQTKMRKTCSRECKAQAQGYALLDEPIECAWCGNPFKRVSSYRKYCGRECVNAAIAAVRQVKRLPPVRCTSCDKPLPHRRGGRCRACWIADPAGTSQAQLPIGGDS